MADDNLLEENRKLRAELAKLRRTMAAKNGGPMNLMAWMTKWTVNMNNTQHTGKVIVSVDYAIPVSVTDQVTSDLRSSISMHELIDPNDDNPEAVARLMVKYQFLLATIEEKRADVAADMLRRLAQLDEEKQR